MAPPTSSCLTLCSARLLNDLNNPRRKVLLLPLTTPTMEQYNIFRQVHRIGRVMLYETAISLQLTHFRSQAEAESIAGKVNAIVLLTEDYLAKEEAFLLPAIAEYEPSVADMFRQELKACTAMLEALSLTAEETISATGYEQRTEAGLRLEIIYTQFLRTQLRLMASKEKTLNPILTRYYPAEFLRTIQEELIQHDDCQASLIQVAWIIKTLEEKELVAWLKAVEKKASSQCMQLVLSAAEEQMDAHRFDRLSGALTEGALVA